MKKKLIAVLSVLALSFALSACSFSLDGLLGSDFGDTSDTVSDTGVEDSSDTGVGNGQDQHVYTAFTPAEEALIYQKVNGAQIPFLPNDEYYVEEYDEVTSTLHKYGVHFYTYGNTQAEYDAYKARFNGYVIKTDYQDENGREWYFFEHERGWGVEMTYYTNADGKSVVSVHIYLSNAVPDPIQPDFTAEEKALFNEYFGFVIPFVASDEYYVEEYTYTYEDTNETEVGLNYHAYGLTSAEFNTYKALFTTANGYKSDGTEEDEFGDTWYYYTKDGYYIDFAYYEYDSDYYVIDVYVYELQDGVDGGEQGGNSGTDFTADEKALFNEYFGFVIPFLESEEYYVEEYSKYYEDTDETEIGVNYYTFGNTQAEFDAYKALFSTANGYTYDGTEEDSYGDSWYYYTKNEHFIDMTYYYYEGEYVLDLYVYDVYEGDQTGGGDQGGSGDQGGGSTENADVITNAGKGLPTDADGVYDVDFTKATYVKNVTEQGYYEDGCPTTGSPKVLVIPVEFSDCTAASKGYTTDKIKAAFEKGGKTDYFSVYDYYFKSSYGKLDLDITVLDDWFMPSKTSTYYATQTIDYYGDQVEAGDQMVMDEALAYLEQGMDLSEFDSDGNAVIDAIVLVTTLEINSDVTYYWAYRYWNIYTDDEGYYYEYDGVSANDYLWAPYQFLYETYDESGNVAYDENVMNTYTFIHEFGHVLGADDYYDTSYSSDYGPMEGCDIMDGMAGDHNAYTKFNYGWLTSSRLVVAEKSVTLTLADFSKNGDTIIIANNWDDDLGAYQEYYVLVYYKNVGLNDGDNGGGYFSRDGVVVYHVNASLYGEDYDGTTSYDVYNNNTDASDENGTADNLIEYVKSANDTFTFVEGDTLPASVKDDNGNSLIYNFVVDSVTDDYVTITFTKK